MSIEEHERRIFQEHSAIFREWRKRASEKPMEFETMKDPETGEPFTDPGAHCATYFKQLYKELFPS